MALSVRRMIERRVEGVAIVTFGLEEALFDDLKSRNVPLVFIDVGPPLPRISNIRIDYIHGIRQAFSIWLRCGMCGSHSFHSFRGH